MMNFARNANRRSPQNSPRSCSHVRSGGFTVLDWMRQVFGSGRFQSGRSEAGNSGICHVKIKETKRL
jgi:hypothetical protein